MPAHVRAIQIDWHYNEVSPELRKLLPELDQRLSSTDHTWTTLREQLRELAVRHLDLAADAFVEDGDRRYWLFRLRPIEPVAGLTLRELGDLRVEELEIHEHLDGAALELPYDEALTVTLVRDLDLVDELEGDDDSIDVPLEYTTTEQMQTLLARIAAAIDEGGGRFVADAGYDRFLVELGPGVAVTRRLEVVTAPALVARLKRGEYQALPGPPRKADTKYAQPLFWPASMLEVLQDRAIELDHSLSHVVQLAFLKARETIARSDREKLEAATRRFGGSTQRQTLYFPGDLLDAMEAQASRLDCSLSFVAQSAVALVHKPILDG
jgi:hypothetical protein